MRTKSQLIALLLLTGAWSFSIYKQKNDKENMSREIQLFDFGNNFRFCIDINTMYK